MGFCLFEDADFPGSFLALNSNHVQDIVPENDGVTCVVEFTAPCFRREKQ